MDPGFEKGAFDLKNPGDLSEPVASRFGYHVIRLEARKPSRQPSFEEVKTRIIDEMRASYVNEKREGVIAAIRSDPKLSVNQEAVDALVFKGDVAGILVSPAPATPGPAK
jgi:peptidyl-prolyl cis-trans isomerase C